MGVGAWENRGAGQEMEQGRAEDERKRQELTVLKTVGRVRNNRKIKI